MKKLILICLLSALSLGAGPKCLCPENTQLAAKYEWGDEWVFAEGEDVVDITGNSAEGNWISETTIKAVSLKAGQDCYVYLYDLPITEGGFSNEIAGGQDISNIQFCEAEPTSIGLKSFSDAFMYQNETAENPLFRPLVLVLVFFIGMSVGYFVIPQRRVKNGP